MSETHRARRWLLAGVMVLFTAGAVELFSLAAYRIVAGRSFSRSELADQRAGRLGTDASADRPRPEVPPHVANKALHPYVGYVVDPLDDAGARRPGVSIYGYLDDRPAVRRRSPDRVVVGVVGGSVAMGFTRSPVAQEILARRLAEMPAFRGRSLDLVRIAVAGYHQPQQLMTLAYLLALGAEFDIVINIDGFNEVALHPAENARLGVFHPYPRGWYASLAGAGLDDAGYVYAVERQRRTAALFSRPGLAHSVTANLVWWLLDRRLAGQVGVERERLLGQKLEDAPYDATGPRRGFADRGAMLDGLVELWKRSSLQLARLSEANGIRYHHFLQPNQYVPDSKPMGPEERALAVQPRHVYRPGAEQGYPLLRRAGSQLVASGVRFTDLTDVFADHPEPLYIDSCCHFGEAGFAIVAEAVADAIAADGSGTAGQE